KRSSALSLKRRLKQNGGKNMIWSLASKILYRMKLKPFLKTLKDPVAAQEQRLLELLRYAEGTTYGKRHQFSDIGCYEDFVDHIPINQYSDLQPYIKQELEGINNSLYPEPIQVVLSTSGSTGKPKLIPQTATCLKSLKRLRIMSFAAAAKIRPFLHGKILVMVAPAVYTRIGEWDVGYGTGQAMKGGSRLIKNKVVPSPDVFDIKDWKLKFRETILQGIKTPKITACGGITSFILALLRRIKYDSIDWLKNEPTLSSKTQHRLLMALTDENTLDLRVLWPDLSVIFHGGVVRDLYEPMIYDLAGDVHIHEVYAGTEACYGIQIYEDLAGVVPMLDDIIFEFTSMRKGPLPPDAETIPLCEVKKNTPYRIIVSTPSTLWRYDLHDVVMFSSLNPLTLQCLGKSTNILNLSGEKVSEQHISAALTIASEEQDALVRDFVVAPQVDSIGACYHLFVEFSHAPNDLRGFTRGFDSALQEVNRLYWEVRTASTISPAVIHPVPSGRFDDFEFKQLQSPQCTIGQTKMPRITTLDQAQEQLLIATATAP
ncbi:MAG: GH3 auxin-responsive promoter family protein, partial [Promethearchaeota archaeon]